MITTDPEIHLLHSEVESVRKGEQRFSSSCRRRERLLESAAAVFASRGLAGTTMAAIAEHAGVSPSVLYADFESKDRLFKNVVKRSMEKRLRNLDRRIAEIPAANFNRFVERLAETTILVCVSDEPDALLTHWALLEAPEYASDLHRHEVGCVRIIWERRFAECFPKSAALSTIQMRLMPYAIQGCLAYGFWLAVLRHCPQSAAAVVRDFAEGIGRVASTFVGE